MTRYRNRAILYLTEALLVVALVLLPIEQDWPALTAVGLFMHLATSLGALPFEVRLWAASPGPGTVFGIRTDVFFKAMAVAGTVLMAAWPLHRWTPAYLAGTFLLAGGAEGLATRPERD